jgi:hypothetical protein
MTVPSPRAVTASSPKTPIGVLTRLQLVPFQYSMPELSTAEISVAKIAAIPSRLTVEFGFGSGLETAFRLAPFQFSMAARRGKRRAFVAAGHGPLPVPLMLRAYRETKDEKYAKLAVMIVNYFSVVDSKFNEQSYVSFTSTRGTVTITPGRALPDPVAIVCVLTGGTIIDGYSFRRRLC